MEHAFLTNFGDTTTPSSLHEEGRAALANLEFPTVRDENWKYTSVKSVLEHNYKLGETDLKDVSSFMLPIDAYTVVLVNGRFVSELSDTDAPVSSINEAQNDHFGAHSKHAEETFEALNAAYYEDGVFVHVPAGTKFDKPIHILHISDNSSGEPISQPRNLVVIGKGAEASLIESYSATADNVSFLNGVTEVVLEEQAKLQHYRIQNESAQSSQINSLAVEQQKGSSFMSLTVTLQGGLVRNNIDVILKGEACSSELLNINLADDSQHIDNKTRVEHAAPHCYSNQLYKAILNDKATGVFNGMIYVHPKAQKTNAFQSNRTMLLSDDATINAKPQLEIYADDVKCSHGATTGQLDDEALFYCRARGIPLEQAWNLLLHAFVEEVMEQVADETMRGVFQKMVEERMNNVL